MLFDDLDWRLDERWPSVPPVQRALAQVTEIWELLVVTHPDYELFRTDGQWGWARKSPTVPAASRLLVRRELVRGTFALIRAARARLHAARRR